MNLDWQVMIDSVGLFPEAAWTTFQVTTLGIFLGLVLGLITAFLRISSIKLLNYPARIYIFLVRGTPIILQLFIIYYGISEIIQLPSFISAVIGLGIHNGAYIGEIFRGTIQSISKGQMEAARSLGMTYPTAMRRIVLPQALKRAIPPLGNQFIIALKDSSLASTIAVHEIFQTARQQGSAQFSMLELLILAGIFYLILTSIFTILVNFAEKKLKHENSEQPEEITNA